MPIQLSKKMEWDLANPLWSAALNPVINNPLILGRQISAIAMIASTPLTINHGLGRTMQGWFLVDNTSSSVVWRTQNLNSTTLTIESSANTTISLWVY